MAPPEDVRRRIAADAVLGDLVRLEQLDALARLAAPVARAEIPSVRKIALPFGYTSESRTMKSVSFALEAA